MSRIPVRPTENFKRAVGEYQKKHGLKSWAQALLHLAAIGYEQETNQVAPEPYENWGGWRGKEASLKALMDYADRVTDGGRNDPVESVE